MFIVLKVFSEIVETGNGHKGQISKIKAQQKQSSTVNIRNCTIKV